MVSASEPLRSVHNGLAQRIVFGPQALDDVGDAVKVAGARRVLVVTSAGRAASDAGQRLVRRLGRAVAAVFDEAGPHVPTPIVQRAVGAARAAGVDGIVSFGGGVVRRSGQGRRVVLRARAGAPARAPPPAHVAVPTTYSGR